MYLVIEKQNGVRVFYTKEYKAQGKTPASMKRTVAEWAENTYVCAKVSSILVSDVPALTQFDYNGTTYTKLADETKAYDAIGEIHTFNEDTIVDV